MVSVAALALAALAGCRPADYRREADQAAARIIQRKQQEALGRSGAFSIEVPADVLRRRLLLAQKLPHSSMASLGTDRLVRDKHWPEKGYPVAAEANAPAPPTVEANRPLVLTLVDALQVGARNNRAYQSAKEDVFTAALDLDLQSNDFRNIFAATLQSVYTNDLSGSKPVGGLDNSAEGSWTRQLKQGAQLTGQIALDLVKLLTFDRSSSLGAMADVSISIPLLQGSGPYIVTEPLTQAQRNVMYSIYMFERYKKRLAVQIASEYLAVLQSKDRIRNAEENYRGLILSTQRARRLSDAGRLPGIQVDQGVQDELRARDRWISALQSYARQLDSFKSTLGLPTDCQIELDYQELARLSQAAAERLKSAAGGAQTQPVYQGEPNQPLDPSKIRLVPPTRQGGGPMELDPEEGVRVALKGRLDLRTAIGEVYDAQRQVVVTADALRAGLTLTGTGQVGQSRSLSSAGQRNAEFKVEHGTYTAGLLLDLPIERTAERNAYRESYISLDRSVRNVQQLEDTIKYEVREALRGLIQARESYSIQVRAVALARRRVASTELFLQAGRAQMRDVLEAQEALLSAQNSLTDALVNYRVAELEFQRDAGVLQVNEKGIWSEYFPKR
ncbi:MAG TPA: TolC family protein [Phycisphaerae bacterium]|nr:TolC family protein [Phycisphaerae bacterium]